MLRWLDRFFARYHLENLTAFILVGTAAFSAYTTFSGDSLGLVSFERVILNGQFWHLFVFPFRIDGQALFGNPWLGLLLYLWIFWMFSSQLEAELGSARFNQFVFLGFGLMMIGALVVPGNWVTAHYLDLAILAAVAYLNPNQTILLFFVVPVRIKWVAIAFIVIVILPAIRAAFGGQWLAALGPLFGLGNFLIFFGPEWLRMRRRRVRPTSFGQVQRMPAAKPAIHRCTVCGVTEREEPQLEFRYCVQCSDHEYCERHLNDHVHQS
jgi:hypothetical protein